MVDRNFSYSWVSSTHYKELANSTCTSVIFVCRHSPNSSMYGTQIELYYDVLPLGEEERAMMKASLQPARESCLKL